MKMAPTLFQVSCHIKSIVAEYEKNTKEGVVIVGHSVLNDIECLYLDKVCFIDTTNFKYKSDQEGRTRKLKDLVKDYLGQDI